MRLSLSALFLIPTLSFLGCIKKQATTSDAFSSDSAKLPAAREFLTWALDDLRKEGYSLGSAHIFALCGMEEDLTPIPDSEQEILMMTLTKKDHESRVLAYYHEKRSGRGAGRLGTPDYLSDVYGTGDTGVYLDESTVKRSDWENGNSKRPRLLPGIHIESEKFEPKGVVRFGGIKKTCVSGWKKLDRDVISKPMFPEMKDCSFTCEQNHITHSYFGNALPQRNCRMDFVWKILRAPMKEKASVTCRKDEAIVSLQWGDGPKEVVKLPD